MLKKVLVEVEDSTWKLLRAQALDESRPVKVVVEDAFQRYLDTPGGSVARVAPSVPVPSEVTVETRAAALKALMDAVKPDAVQRGSDLMPEKTPRQRERERVARQDWLREHPEDDAPA
jgi:hypothetical protein